MAGPLVGPLLTAAAAAAVGLAVLTTSVTSPPAAGGPTAARPPLAADPAPPGPRPSARPSRVSAAAAPPLLPPPGKAFFGIATAGGAYDLRQVDAAASAAGRRPHVLLFSQDWQHDEFDAAPLEAVRDAGLVPMVAWEPWDGRRGGASERERAAQPAFRLRTSRPAASTRMSALGRAVFETCARRWHCASRTR